MGKWWPFNGRSTVCNKTNMGRKNRNCDGAKGAKISSSAPRHANHASNRVDQSGVGAYAGSAPDIFFVSAAYVPHIFYTGNFSNP